MDIPLYPSMLTTETLTILGYQEDSVSRIKRSDIYYFEAVNGKVFVYSKNKVVEVKQKLYELEELCKEKNCFRASIRMEPTLLWCSPMEHSELRIFLNEFLITIQLKIGCI